jgi:flagellar biosynthesis protein FliR
VTAIPTTIPTTAESRVAPSVRLIWAVVICRIVLRVWVNWVSDGKMSESMVRCTCSDEM